VQFDLARGGIVHRRRACIRGRSTKLAVHPGRLTTSNGFNSSMAALNAFEATANGVSFDLGIAVTGFQWCPPAGGK